MEFGERLRGWARDLFTWKKLRWLIPTAVFELIRQMAEDRIIGRLNKFVDDHSDTLLGKLAAIARFFVAHPVRGAVILAILTFVVLAVHAYFETRPREPELSNVPRLSPAPKTDGRWTTRWQDSEYTPPDLWLGFDGEGPNATLCLQNKGPEPLFNVSVRIPEDGSCFTSNPPINRVDPDGSPYPCPSGTYGGIKNSVALQMVRGELSATGKSIPVRIVYSTQKVKNVVFDQLELGLPYMPSSFRRRS